MCEREFPQCHVYSCLVWCICDGPRCSCLHAYVHTAVAATLVCVLGGIRMVSRCCSLSHCSLSQENLLLDDQGNIKLIDFGLCAEPEVSAALPSGLDWMAGVGNQILSTYTEPSMKLHRIA